MPITRYELSAQEMMLLQSQLRDETKSLSLAYTMLLGARTGLHRFYLGRTSSAIVQLVLFVFTVLFYGLSSLMSVVESEGGLIAFGILTFLFGFSLFVWIVVDLFLLPRMVSEYNARAEYAVLEQIQALRQQPAENNRPTTQPHSASAPAPTPPSPISLDKNE